MKKLTLSFLLVISSIIISPIEVISQVLDGGDPIVEYDENNPPKIPAVNTLAKWVITKEVSWDTQDWKAYYYNGVPFRLKWPKNYDPNRSEKYPMIIILHGLGFKDGTIYMNDRHLNNAGALAFDDAIDDGRWDGFVLSPQSNSGFWGVSQFNALEQIVNLASSQVNLDLNRISVNGRSGGAQAVWYFVSEKPRLFAAGLPMSGSGDYYSGIPNYKYVKIWVFQGENDTAPSPVVTENLNAAVVAAGGNLRYTKYLNSGHSIFDKGYAEQDFFPFMARASKTNPVVLTGEYLKILDNSSKLVYEFVKKTEFCPGDQVLAVLGLSPGFEGYEWEKDNQVILGANSNEFQVIEYGIYRARFKRNGAWSEWSTQPIEIKEKDPTVTPDIQLADVASFALPTADDKDYVDLTLPDGYVQYSWFLNGSSQLLGSNKLFRVTQPGEYVASVVEPFGCSSNLSNPFVVIDATGANPPDAATDLTVTMVNETSIQINWANNPAPQVNELGFEVYRAESSGNFKFIKLIDQNVLYFLDEGLSANTEYDYFIRSISQGGAASNSNVVHAKTKADIVPPTAPLNLQVVASTPNSVSLKWETSTDDVGIFKYDIFKDDIKVLVSDELEITVYNLASNKPNKFFVRARDLAGNASPFSNQVVAVTSLSPMAELKFNSNFNDDSGNGTVSLPVNGPFFDNIVVKEGSHSLGFDNSNDYVDFADNQSFVHDLFNTRTVAFWLNTKSTGSVQDLFDEGGSTNGFGIRINNGSIELTVQDNQVIRSVSASFASSNEWHHIAGVFSNGSLMLYIDGSLVNSRSDLPFSSIRAHSDESGIGGTNGTNAFDVVSNNFQGYIDHFYFDDDALTVTQIKTLMEGTVFELPDITPLAATNFNANAISYDQIELTWDHNGVDATGMQLYRSVTKDGPYYPITITKPDINNYVDDNLSPETTYYYKLVTLGEYNQSEPVQSLAAVHHMMFNGDLSDESSNGVVSTVINSPQYDNARKIGGSGSSIYFPGGNDLLNIDNGDQYIHTAFNNRSIAMWVFIESSGGKQDFFDEGGSTNGLAIRINDGEVEVCAADNQSRKYLSYPINIGEWTHVGVTYEDGLLKLFVNGEEVGSLSTGFDSGEISRHTDAGGLGGTNSSNAFNSTNNNFNGWIDEYYAFDVTLSSLDIYNLAHLSLPKPVATTFPLPPSPNAPESLIATSLSSTAINLSWSDKSSDEDGFNVYRSIGGNDNFLLLATIPAGDNETVEYTNSNLFANVEYHYKVSAFNVGGEEFSNEAFTITENGIPSINDIDDVYMHSSSVVEIDLTAFDPDSDPISFECSNCGDKPFVTVSTINDDGVGLLKIEPLGSYLGIYQIIVKVADTNGGKDSTSFELNINSNNPPAISGVQDVLVSEGEVDSFIFTYDDLNVGDILTVTTENAPEFVEIDLSNANQGVVTVTPGYADNGYYDNIKIIIEDDQGGFVAKSFSVTVADVDLNQSIFANITQTSMAGVPWNNITGLSTQNLSDQNGNQTEIDLSFTPAVWKSWTDGSVTGDNSGIFVDNVIRDYFYFGIFGAPNVVDLTISDLDVSQKYKITLFASSKWTGTSDNGTTVYTIDGVSKGLYVQNNSNNVVTFEGVSPNSEGEIVVTMSKGINTPVGYLNALVVENIFQDGTVPVSARDLTSEFNDADNSVELSWIDAAYNELGYNIFRSVAGGSFVQINPESLPIGTATYVDDLVVEGETYEYKVEAFNSYGSSESDVVGITISNLPPKIEVIQAFESKTDEVSVVGISVSDPPYNNFLFDALSLPDFCELNNLGDGEYELIISPILSDTGNYVLTFEAEDYLGAITQQELLLSVVNKPLYSVYFNFSQNSNAGTPWNNSSKAPVNGDIFSGLKDDSGAITGVGLQLTTSYGGVYGMGAITGDNSGVVPDNVLQEYYYFGIYGAPEIAGFKLTGLDLTKSYRLKFIGSSTYSGQGITDNGETIYRVGNKTVALDVQDNTSRFAVVGDLIPENELGEINVQLLKGADAAIGYINGLIIEVFDGNPELYNPDGLIASAITTSSIKLSWNDNSLIESGYEIYKSESGQSNSYNLIGNVGSNVTSFIDENLQQDEIYYYLVRAILPDDQYSEFSNVASSGTISFSVYININGVSLYDAQVPWNNISYLPPAGDILYGFKNQDGNETGITMEIITPMEGDNDWGMTTGNNSGIFPDNVLKSFYFNDALGAPGQFNFRGLQGGYKYNFSFFGSIDVTNNVRTNFTIGETTVVNNQTQNLTEIVTIPDVVPDENHEVLVHIQEAPGSKWAIFNAMIIDAVPVPQNSNARSSDHVVSSFGNHKVNFGLGDVYFDIYPNPIKDDMNVFVSNLGSSGQLSYIISDLNGRVILERSSNSNQFVISDLGNALNTGVYLLRLDLQDGVERVFKFIVE